MHFQCSFDLRRPLNEVRKCRHEEEAEDNAQPLITSPCNPKQQVVYHIKELRSWLEKEGLSRAFIWLTVSCAWCLCTCVHAWLQKCTHLLMLCQSWRAVSTMTTGLQFPWRPVHRSWSLNLGRPELTAFSHALCRYNGRTPEPWCPTAKEKKKDFASCSKVAIFTLHNNAWLEYEWKNCRKLSFSDLLTFASVVSNQVVSR